MKIADGVYMLELEAEMGGQRRILNAALLCDEQDVILVDAGLAGMLPGIQAAFAGAGVDFAGLNKVIITHHDRDHIGSLSEVAAAAPKKVEIMAHADEIPFIEASAHLMEKIDKMAMTFPAEQRELLREAYRGREGVPVDTALADGQELPYCGGIVAVHTPGHTPGHICLYLKKSKTLIAGDGMVAESGELSGPVDMFTVNMEQAVRSLGKLADYDIETVICYHGGVIRENANRRIAEIAAGKF